MDNAKTENIWDSLAALVTSLGVFSGYILHNSMLNHQDPKGEDSRLICDV